MQLIYSTSKKPICVGTELCKERNYLSFRRDRKTLTLVRFGLLFLSLPLSSQGRRGKTRWWWWWRRRRRRRNRLAATSHFSSRGGADQVGESRHYPPLYLYSYAEHRSAITIPWQTDPATNSGGDFSSVKIQREPVITQSVNLPYRFSWTASKGLGVFTVS